MSKESNKNSIKGSLKPTLKVTNVKQLQNENPNLQYTWLRTDSTFDPNQDFLDDYDKNGWEIVSTTSVVKDDYESTKSRDSLENYKPVPMTRKGRGGAEFVLISIPKEQYILNEKERVKRDQEQFYASSSDHKIERHGQNLKITAPEANINTKL